MVLYTCSCPLLTVSVPQSFRAKGLSLSHDTCNYCPLQYSWAVRTGWTVVTLLRNVTTDDSYWLEWCPKSRLNYTRNAIEMFLFIFSYWTLQDLLWRVLYSNHSSPGLFCHGTKTNVVKIIREISLAELESAILNWYKSIAVPSLVLFFC